MADDDKELEEFERGERKGGRREVLDPA